MATIKAFAIHKLYINDQWVEASTPNNISLFETEDEPLLTKLIDFGAARKATDEEIALFIAANPTVEIPAPTKTFHERPLSGAPGDPQGAPLRRVGKQTKPVTAEEAAARGKAEAEAREAAADAAAAKEKAAAEAAADAAAKEKAAAEAAAKESGQSDDDL